MSKYSKINFISRLLSLLVLSIFSIILNNLIITKYGSSLNGIFATASQLSNFLLVLEGGVGLSTTVKMYKLIEDNNILGIKKLRTMVQKYYNRITNFIIFIGFIVSIIFSFLIISVQSPLFSFLFLFLSILSSALSIRYISVFLILYNANNQEYIGTFTSLFFTLLSNLIAIFLIYKNSSLIIVKIILLFFPILKIFIFRFIEIKIQRYRVYELTKNNVTPLLISSGEVSTEIDNDKKNLLESKKDIKDIVILKFSSLIFNSTDILLLSFFISTSASSIYYVYNLFSNFIRGILSSIFLAQYHEFGILYSTYKTKELKDKYEKYQFYSINILFIATVINLVLLPHIIKFYTKDFLDAQYFDNWTVILFIFNLFLSLLGEIFSLTNSTGNFKLMKWPTGISALFNILLSLILINNFGMNGILFATALSYIFLFSYQGYIVHYKIINNGISNLINILFNSILSSVISLLIILSLPTFNLDSFFSLILLLLVSTGITVSVFLLNNYIFFKRFFFQILIR